MKKSTREWVSKAEDDYRVTAVLAQRKEPFHDHVCFHCQQSAEKYLKALLEELGIDVEKTHELKNIQMLLLPHHPQLRALRRGLEFLTMFAVSPRYPGKNTTKRQAMAARRWADKVRATCLDALGMKPPTRRPKRS